MNKRIKGIAIASLQNHEHYGFVTEVKLAIEQANIDSLATLLAKFTPLVEEENKSLEIVAKSEHTHRLKELDRNRDNMFRGLSACVNEASYSPTKDEKEAATLIKILLKRYGNIISESFESQHSKTENLIQDLRSEKYAEASKKIGLVRWVNWLEQAETTFMELYRTRRDERASTIAGTRALKLIRKDLNGVYREIIEHLNALAVLQPSEALTQLIARINIHIDKLVALKANRSTRAKKSIKNSGNSAKEN